MVDHPLLDVSPASIAAAIERNTEEFLMTLGRAGGGEERDDEHVRWTIGGSPIDYHNAVVRTDLTPGNADDAIAASIERMRAHGVPGSWHVGPSMRPADLGQRLEAHGFVLGAEEPGMAINLEHLQEMPAVPDGFTIERVNDGAGLAAWTDTLAQGFGAGPHEAIWTGEMYARLGLDPEGAWHHYLARLDGKPVATSSMLFAAGVAGIYFVFTLPEARRQGLGAAVTWAALRDAKAKDYRIGILGSSPMGYSVYLGMEFEEYCKTAIYEWSPPAG